MIPKPKSKYIVFTFLFLVFSFFVYCSFIFTGTTFIKGGDGLKQHIVSLIYYGDYLRSLLSGTVPQWDFNIGEGADIIQTLNYYVIGDPSALLAIFFPAKYMHICYNLISLIKLYCAGCAFIFMCSHFKQKQTVGILVAALSYAFSAWAFIHSTRHPFFINPMIYMPLIIVGIDRLLKEKKPVLFTLAVAVAGISNVYFFYMIAILTAVYVLTLLVFTYRGDLKSIFIKLFFVSVFAVAGTLMAAVILLPVINFFLADSRAGGFVFQLFYSPQYYLKVPMTFIVPEDIGYFMWLSLSAVAFIALVSLFMRKGNGFLKILVIVSVFFFLFPIFGQILNRFSYLSHRWCWAFVLLSCYILASQWEEICLIRSSVWLISGSLILSYFILFHLVYPQKMHIGISFVNTFIFFLLWVVFLRTKDKKIRYITIVSTVILSIVINANYQYCITGFRKTCIKPEQLKILFDNEATAIKSLKDKGFYRFSGNKLTYNINMLSGISSPQYYWSMSNNNISEYRKSLGRVDNFGYHSYCDYDSRTIMEALASVRYYYTKNQDKVPYGYEPSALKNIYKSSNALPFGYTYDSYIIREEFENYSEIKKQQILVQSMVLDKPVSADQHSQLFFNDKKIEYVVKPSDNISFEKGKIIVGKENASLKLCFRGVGDTETYLCFKNLKFDGKVKYWFYEYSYYRVPIYISQNGKDREFMFCQPNEPYYADIHDFVFNLGYSKEPKKEVMLTFEKKGTYSFDEMSVICQPFDAFPTQVENLKKDSWTDVHFGINRVSGTVDFSADKLLLISIPYSKGWSAFIDGKKREVLQGNIMNLALPVEEGKHQIELVYETPLLKAGFFISLTTIILFTLFMMMKRWKERSKAA